MYPVLFRIGGFEITSFGVMTALGALAGLWVLRHELAARGMSYASDTGWSGVFGGLRGAFVRAATASSTKSRMMEPT